MHRHPTRPPAPGSVFGPLLGAVLVLAACAGEPATTSAEVPTPTTAPVIDPAPADDADQAEPTPSDDGASTDAAAEEVTATTIPSTTTAVEPSPTTEVDLPAVTADAFPDLVVAWADADGDPLELARRLIGFPLDVAVPADATPFDLGLRMRRDIESGSARWEWRYGATVSSVGQIDAELPEGGPGTIEGRLHYDPLFDALGWRTVSQVISDPSNGGGGPQSVNWAYEKADPVLVVDGVELEVVVGRAWVDEDLDYRDGTDRPGHEVEVTLRTTSDAVLVPFLTLVDEALAMPGALLLETNLASYERPPDSYAAEEGLRYLELELVYVVDDRPDDALRDRLSTRLAGSVFQPGEESSFDEGFIRTVLTDPLAEDWRQPVVFLDRYPGRIEITPLPDSQAEVLVRVTLEPNREPLLPLPAD